MAAGKVGKRGRSRKRATAAGRRGKWHDVVSGRESSKPQPVTVTRVQAGRG